MPIELVIFDCDGVLIDSEGLSAHVLLSELAALGIHVDFDHFCQHFLGRSFPTVAQEIRQTFDRPLPEGFEQRYRSRLLDAFRDGLKVTPGVEDILARLAPQRCVATSSSPQRVSNSLRIVGLDQSFDRVFTASEVARGKPAPDLFLHAAARCGVPPDRCLVIEDSLPGLAAAHAAGMQVLRYTGGAHLRGRALKHDREIRTFDIWPQLFDLLPELERT